MPAQPSTIASAPSSASARSISSWMVRRARESGSSSASTGTLEARTRAQRAARPYLTRLCSIGASERASVVTTLNLCAIRLATGNAASPMPMTGSSATQRAASRHIVETGDDEGVGVAALADLFEKARQRIHLVEIALDTGRAIGWVGGQDLDAGRSGGASCGL